MLRLYQYPKQEYWKALGSLVSQPPRNTRNPAQTGFDGSKKEQL